MSPEWALFFRAWLVIGAIFTVGCIVLESQAPWGFDFEEFLEMWAILVIFATPLGLLGLAVLLRALMWAFTGT